MDFDYKKLPWYWRLFPGLQGLWCRLGWHVPVVVDDGFMKEVFCQECAKDLRLVDWIKFFEKARR